MAHESRFWGDNSPLVLPASLPHLPCSPELPARGPCSGDPFGVTDQVWAADQPSGHRRHDPGPGNAKQLAEAAARAGHKTGSPRSAGRGCSRAQGCWPRPGSVGRMCAGPSSCWCQAGGTAAMNGPQSHLKGTLCPASHTWPRRGQLSNSSSSSRSRKQSADPGPGREGRMAPHCATRASRQGCPKLSTAAATSSPT